MDEELAGGLLCRELWDDFAAPQPLRRSTACAPGSTSSARPAGRVAGYGAAAKGNTLMNAAGVRSDDLVVVVDGSEAQAGQVPARHAGPGRGARAPAASTPTTC